MLTIRQQVRAAGPALVLGPEYRSNNNQNPNPEPCRNRIDRTETYPVVCTLVPTVRTQLRFTLRLKFTKAVIPNTGVLIPRKETAVTTDTMRVTGSAPLNFCS